MNKFVCLLLFLGIATAIRAQQPINSGGKSIVQLSLNENPYGPPVGVNQAIEKELRQLARYAGEECT